MNKEILVSGINKFWDDKIIPALIDYIKIPNKSPSFDPDWEKHGHMDKVLDLAVNWANKNKPNGSTLTVERTTGRTPIILLDVPGTVDGNILMYGHLDKQPEMSGWKNNLGPWTPVIKNDKLYGRGGADDGYALFASLCAIKTLTKASIVLRRILIIFEFCEEGG